MISAFASRKRPRPKAPSCPVCASTTLITDDVGGINCSDCGAVIKRGQEVVSNADPNLIVRVRGNAVVRRQASRKVSRKLTEPIYGTLSKEICLQVYQGILQIQTKALKEILGSHFESVAASVRSLWFVYCDCLVASGQNILEAFYKRKNGNKAVDTLAQLPNLKLSLTLAFLLLGARGVGAPVLAWDICRWARTGVLPYLHGLDLVPEEHRKGPIRRISAFFTNRPVPSARQVLLYTIALEKALQVHSKKVTDLGEVGDSAKKESWKGIPFDSLIHRPAQVVQVVTRLCMVLPEVLEAEKGILMVFFILSNEVWEVNSILRALKEHEDMFALLCFGLSVEFPPCNATRLKRRLTQFEVEDGTALGDGDNVASDPPWEISDAARKLAQPGALLRYCKFLSNTVLRQSSVPSSLTKYQKILKGVSKQDQAAQYTGWGSNPGHTFHQPKASRNFLESAVPELADVEAWENESEDDLKTLLQNTCAKWRSVCRHVPRTRHARTFDETASKATTNVLVRLVEVISDLFDLDCKNLHTCCIRLSRHLQKKLEVDQTELEINAQTLDNLHGIISSTNSTPFPYTNCNPI